MPLVVCNVAVPEPDLDRLDRMVDGDLTGDGGAGRGRRAAELAAEALPPVQPDWSRTLVGLLERLLERLDRLEADVEDVGKRLDASANGLADGLTDALEPLQRTEDAVAVLSGQVSGIDGQLRDLRAELARLVDAWGR